MIGTIVVISHTVKLISKGSWTRGSAIFILSRFSKFKIALMGIFFHTIAPHRPIIRAIFRCFILRCNHALKHLKQRIRGYNQKIQIANNAYYIKYRSAKSLHSSQLNKMIIAG
jgi:hypothetical protein